MSRTRVERNISYDDVRCRYYVTLEFGIDPATGKQIKKTKTFPKLAQARAALRKHEAARDVGTVVLPRDITLAQWLTDWMNNVVRLSRASTTAYAYQHIISAHIIPTLETCRYKSSPLSSSSSTTPSSSGTRGSAPTRPESITTCSTPH